MALTTTKVAGAGSAVPVNGGSVNIVQLRVTFDSSYATGGEPFTAAQLGLNNILAVIAGANTAGNRLVAWDDVNGKLLLFTALGVEAVNATDQSTIVAVITVIGT